MPLLLPLVTAFIVGWFSHVHAASADTNLSNQGHDPTAETKWQAVAEDAKPINEGWVEGAFANLGFTASQLLIHTRLDLTASSDYYLKLSPIYIDNVRIRFTDVSTERPSIIHDVGDLDPQLSSEDIVRAPSQVFVRIPPGTSDVNIAASSTSNLRLSVDYVTDIELSGLTQDYAFGTSLLFTTLLISILVAGSAALIYRSKSLLLFIAYQTSWLVLLAGIHYPVLSTPIWNLASNHWVVSIGAITATLFGALAHAQIIYEFSGTRFIPRILHTAAALCVVLLLTAFSGYERLALKLNIILISTIPALLLILIPLIRQQQTSMNVWRRIKYGYVVLMGSVVVTGVSGLGIGDLFDITYIHALLTTLLMSGILVMGLRAQNAQLREQAQQSRLESQKSKLLEEQLSESKAMFEMLSHEIKTPLTTLSMLLISSKNRERAGRQIEAIRTIIEQTAIALNISNLHSNPEYHNLERAVLDNWQFLASQSEGRTLDLRVDPAVSVYADGLLMDIALRNVLKNAMKYSVPSSAVKVYTVTRGLDILLVVSNQSKIVYDDDSSFFRKYWRSAESRSIRGSGLGLWLVKRIAEEAGINVSIELSRNTFRMLFHIPEKRQRQ